MTHRADQIINAVVAAIQASSTLAVPEAAIFAHRSLSLSENEGEVPAVTVNMGEDRPVSDLGNDNLAFIDSELEVLIVGYDSDKDEASVKRSLLAQRAAIYVALLADQSLGLDFVMGTRYGGAAAPELNAATESIIGSLESRWTVFYRMNILDPN